MSQDEQNCYACRLSRGEETLFGGTIHESVTWRIEHCMGPLGTGTLIVKPVRHVVDVHALTSEEAMEMGPVIKEAARVVSELTSADRTYVCLWSHPDWTCVHIHFVVQPVWNDQKDRYSGGGPTLQSEMFKAAEPLDRQAVEVFCDAARKVWRH
jgi:diadenosine tetraphosphate (Ap4A) HIT family hydrolase